MAAVARIFVLVLAGGWLLHVAVTSREQSYVPPTAEAAAGHHPAPVALRGSVPADCVVRTYEVEGMCCTGCTGKLYAALTEVPEVRDAAVSFEEGVARAVVPASYDARLLEPVLTRDKYTARLQATTTD